MNASFDKRAQFGTCLLKKVHYALLLLCLLMLPHSAYSEETGKRLLYQECSELEGKRLLRKESTPEATTNLLYNNKPAPLVGQGAKERNGSVNPNWAESRAKTGVAALDPGLVTGCARRNDLYACKELRYDLQYQCNKKNDTWACRKLREVSYLIGQLEALNGGFGFQTIFPW